jgi:transcriptional regulator with XRE-family HTH domain
MTPLKRRFVDAGLCPFEIWRREQGLTRAEFARLLGISYNMAYNLEKGHLAHLPERLRWAIIEAGLPDTLIGAYYRWRGGLPWQNTQKPESPPGR